MTNPELVLLTEQDGSASVSFPLETEVTRIGRAEDNEITLHDECVSRATG
jgi:pSer/pThr/pTyr-binding forkhead associated (FHA) protein